MAPANGNVPQLFSHANTRKIPSENNVFFLFCTGIISLPFLRMDDSYDSQIEQKKSKLCQLQNIERETVIPIKNNSFILNRNKGFLSPGSKVRNSIIKASLERGCHFQLAHGCTSHSEVTVCMCNKEKRQM